MILGIANGMLYGIPALMAAAAKAALAALKQTQDSLLMHSPSGKFMELGVFAGQGFALGLAQALDGQRIAGLLARPVANNSGALSQQNIFHLGNGLTMSQAAAMIAANNEQIMDTLYRAFRTHG
jgi:hypothetical protein